MMAIRQRPVLNFTQQKEQKLQTIDTWTKAAIIGGFISSAAGAEYRYDSDENDQKNLMLAAQVSASPDFATHPQYQGKMPIRAVPKGQTEKEIIQHTAAQVQKVVGDMALHISVCKQRGWVLQESAEVAKTMGDLDKIVW